MIIKAIRGSFESYLDPVCSDLTLDNTGQAKPAFAARSVVENEAPDFRKTVGRTIFVLRWVWNCAQSKSCARLSFCGRSRDCGDAAAVFFVELFDPCFMVFGVNWI